MSLFYVLSNFWVIKSKFITHIHYSYPTINLWEFLSSPSENGTWLSSKIVIPLITQSKGIENDCTNNLCTEFNVILCPILGKLISERADFSKQLIVLFVNDLNH